MEAPGDMLFTIQGVCCQISITGVVLVATEYVLKLESQRKESFVSSDSIFGPSHQSRREHLECGNSTYF